MGVRRAGGDGDEIHLGRRNWQRPRELRRGRLRRRVGAHRPHGFVRGERVRAARHARQRGGDGRGLLGPILRRRADGRQPAARLRVPGACPSGRILGGRASRLARGGPRFRDPDRGGQHLGVPGGSGVRPLRRSTVADSGLPNHIALIGPGDLRQRAVSKSCEWRTGSRQPKMLRVAASHSFCWPASELFAVARAGRRLGRRRGHDRMATVSVRPLDGRSPATRLRACASPDRHATRAQVLPGEVGDVARRVLQQTHDDQGNGFPLVYAASVDLRSLRPRS